MVRVSSIVLILVRIGQIAWLAIWKTYAWWKGKWATVPSEKTPRGWSKVFSRNAWSLITMKDWGRACSAPQFCLRCSKQIFYQPLKSWATQQVPQPIASERLWPAPERWLCQVTATVFYPVGTSTWAYEMRTPPVFELHNLLYGCGCHACKSVLIQSFVST